MNAQMPAPAAKGAPFDPSLSLFQLLDPAVHANPFPFTGASARKRR